MPENTGSARWGWLLIALSLVLGTVATVAWSPCFADLGGESVSNACRTAMSTQLPFGAFVLVWLPAFAVAVHILAQEDRSILSWIPLVCVIGGFPLLDRGFFWRDWDSPDAIPGQGLQVAVFVLLAGIAIIAPSARHRRGVIESAQARPRAVSPIP